jgi:alpha-1,3-rhamnosyltransferase
MPSISAIVTSANQSQFVLEALASIEAQDQRPDQVVVVDDASTDGSQRLISDWFARTGIAGELVANDANLGICRVMNRGLERATGEYIAVLHGDDLWLPSKLQVQAAALDAAPEHVSLVYSDAEVIDEAGRALGPSALDRYGVRHPRPSGRVAGLLIGRELSLPAPSTLIRRRWLDAVGPYDERLRAEDYNMWLRLAVRSEFRYVDACVAKYRVVPTSLSHVLRNVYLQDDLMTITRVLDEGGEPRQALLRHQARLASHVHRHGPKARAALRARIRHEQPARAAALAVLTLGGLVPQGLGLAARLRRKAG